MQEFIGEGQFGSIHGAIWHQTGKTKVEVAMKSLKKNSMDGERVQFLQEAAIMAQFKNTNVVRLYGVVTDSNQQVSLMM